MQEALLLAVVYSFCHLPGLSVESLAAFCITIGRMVDPDAPNSQEPKEAHAACRQEREVLKSRTPLFNLVSNSQKNDPFFSEPLLI